MATDPMDDLVPRHAQALVNEALSDTFVAGYVLYTGQRTLPFGEKIRALPLEALWQLAP